MPPAARILAGATALPGHEHTQAEIQAAVASLLGADPRLAALLPVFDAAGVARRRFVRPLDWYLERRGFEERNDEAVRAAVDLGESCLGAALARAGLAPRELDHLVVATTTSLATPSIDARLLHRMGLRPDLERTPLFGAGCAGGAVGLARAADLASARPGARVAVLAVETCSLAFRGEDPDAAAVVGAALFGDGAAALVLEASAGPGPVVAAHASHTFADSLAVMGWRFDSHGLGLVLSRELPALVEGECPAVLHRFLAAAGLEVGAIDRFAVHPGGPKVIDSLERALGTRPGALDSSRDLLARHGNLSSASVPFLLAELVDRPAPAAGARDLVLAFGPGFSAEIVLLRWS